MDCYEILQVNHDSDLQEIKANYRKLALQYHPDRNPGIEDYNEIFSQINAAYNILSNDDKRKWHEKDYLRNQYSVQIEDVLQHLQTIEKIPFESTSAFVERLRQDEKIAGSTDDLPTLGDTTWLWTYAKPIYQKWLRFSTKKSFEWEALYNEEEESDAATRRLMKRQNQRQIQYCIQRYNELVRDLIGKACDLDPRRKNVVKLSDGERYNSLQEASRKQSERDRRQYQETFKNQSIASWTIIDQEETSSDDESLSKEIVNSNPIMCMVCNKNFRSQNQLENHENSKKHKKNLRKMNQEIKKHAKEAQKNAESNKQPEDAPSESPYSNKVSSSDFYTRSFEEIEKTFTFVEISDNEFYTASEDGFLNEDDKLDQD